MKLLPLLLLPVVYGMCMCRIRWITHDITHSYLSFTRVISEVPAMLQNRLHEILSKSCFFSYN